MVIAKTLRFNRNEHGIEIIDSSNHEKEWQLQSLPSIFPGAVYRNWNDQRANITINLGDICDICDDRWPVKNVSSAAKHWTQTKAGRGQWEHQSGSAGFVWSSDKHDSRKSSTKHESDSGKKRMFHEVYLESKLTWQWEIHLFQFFKIHL